MSNLPVCTVADEFNNLMKSICYETNELGAIKRLLLKKYLSIFVIAACLPVRCTQTGPQSFCSSVMPACLASFLFPLNKGG